MIFTGYVFPDAPSISPYLEDPHTGPTARFCAALAARLRCYVVAGYPERLPPCEVETATLEDGRTVERVGANAAALYGPDGAFVGGYRKTNLYETDMTWAKPGTGFTTHALPLPLGPLTLAICMDLNLRPPASWASLAAGPYELAEYCVRERARVLVLLCAWLDSGEGGEGGEGEKEVDWRTVNYWAMRLRPLWARVREEAEADADARSDLDSDSGSEDSIPDEANGHGADQEAGRKAGEELLVVICNRCGTENGASFPPFPLSFSLSPFPSLLLPLSFPPLPY
ncbi:hypothetical protein OH77DRAFT_1428296 [Trametes cingulata]|nr:hypothetical protein OH77DRAFT_1428296 [Trametes cingulata]